MGFASPATVHLWVHCCCCWLLLTKSLISTPLQQIFKNSPAGDLPKPYGKHATCPMPRYPRMLAPSTAGLSRQQVRPSIERDPAVLCSPPNSQGAVNQSPPRAEMRVMRVQDTVADELPYARVHARTPAKSTAHSATITGHSCKPVETQATCSEAASMLTVEQKHARWQELLCQTLDVSDCGHTRALLGPATHLNALDTALCTQYPTAAPKSPPFNC